MKIIELSQFDGVRTRAQFTEADIRPRIDGIGGSQHTNPAHGRQFRGGLTVKQFWVAMKIIEVSHFRGNDTRN